ncbi:unnamed protein product [Ilex paraguariensis]
MGIDPHTHEPSSNSNGPLNRLPASPSTRHMAQWESARLEAEARLSRESSFLASPSAGRIDTDYFLRIWNSEIGESFRKIKNDKTACQSPASQLSSSTKYGSVSGTTTEMGLIVAGSSAAGSNQNEDTECKSSKLCTEDVTGGSDSSISNELDLEDSSESALQLLLDFPGNNDMSFLEEHTVDYAMYHAISTESSLNCSI